MLLHHYSKAFSIARRCFDCISPPTSPVLGLWCYSWSGKPRPRCRCGSRTACNHMTGRCRCWPGGSPCLLAALTCKAGRTVSSRQNSVSPSAFQRLLSTQTRGVITWAVVGVWQLSPLCAASATYTQVDNRDVLSVWCSPPPIPLNPGRVECVHLTAPAGGLLAFCHATQRSYLVSKVQAVPQWQVLLDDGRFVRFSLLKWWQLRKTASWNIKQPKNIVTKVNVWGQK